MSCKKNSQKQNKISNNIFPTNSNDANDMVGNLSSQKSIDNSSDDIIKINQKHYYIGNKERKNIGNLKDNKQIYWNLLILQVKIIC